MQCSRCSRENPESAKFCVKCGARLALVCTQCGTELAPDPDVRFCRECGTEVERPPSEAADERDSTAVKALERLVPKEFAERLLATRGQVEAERRMVTILFSDVKGSTAMAEDLDPEEVMEIMNGAFDVLIKPVYRYEGTLARLMGDAILAFFGAPIAHEDDPERACRAALEIIEGAKLYAAKLEEERGITGFNVRVGINTGLVVVGEVGSDLRVEYTAMGDAINLAARMESTAQPGTVLITENTHKLIAALFETEGLGPIEVKGKAEAISVYRVLAAKEVPGKVRGIAGLESPLVGREAEFAALQESMERLQAGVGGIVTLVGEAGLGKSRLVAELRKQAVGAIPPPHRPAQTGWSPPHWVEGRCLSYGTSIAYQLWMDVLRGLLGVTAEASPEAVRETLRERVSAVCPDSFDDVYRYLGHMMSLPLEDEHEAALRDSGGEKLRAGMFAAIETLLGCTATERPVIVVCEDLHWADATSLDLLEHLLSLTDRSSLLLICAFRPELEHGCWRIKEIATREYPHRHLDLRLQPLSTADSAVLVGNLLQVEDLPPVLKERILEHAEGNPFYVEEILRSLVDQGAIFRDEDSGRWLAGQDAADVAIPDTLQGVLLARIDRLQEATKRVLQMAAVIGRVFLCRVLEAVAAEERELDKHLVTLQREQMIRERARIPEVEYIFKHELTREAAYNGLLKAERRAFHGLVAEALEELFPERIEELLGLLAHHWERAGDAEKATAYLQGAGDRARGLYAHVEAIHACQRALAYLREQGDAGRERAARILMKLGLTYHTAFQFEESRQAYKEAFALWQQAAASQPAVPPPAARHALRVPWHSNIRTLDPAISSDIFSTGVIVQLFAGLVQLTPELDVVPDVARSWEVLEGGRKYVFHLRNDMRWSNGTPVTAHDFEYAWKRVLDPAIGSRNASLLYVVRGAQAYSRGEVSDPDTIGVRASDPFTLSVELEGPTGYFLQLLTHTATYPVPHQVVEAHGERWTQPSNIVSNGPFRLQDWRSGDSVVLVRNPGYRGHFRGNVERVELRLISDWSGSLARYEADALDVLGLKQLPRSEKDFAKQRHAGEYVVLPMLSSSAVIFRVSMPPFDDRRVRRALALSTDQETLVDVVLGGHLVPATGGYLPPGMPEHSPGMALPYDPEGARQLLAEAGYPGGRGFPRVVAVTGPLHRVATEHLQAQWRQNLGIDIAFEPPKRSASVASKGEPEHLRATGWVADYPDPDTFLGASSSLGPAFLGEAYEGLVERARRLTDQEERMSLYREADRMLVEEAAVVPLTYNRDHWLVKPWVRGFSERWKDVIIEPH